MIAIRAFTEPSPIKFEDYLFNLAKQCQKCKDKQKYVRGLVKYAEFMTLGA